MKLHNKQRRNWMRYALRVILGAIVLTIGGLSGIHANPPITPDNTIIVYYFHRTIRCPSCTLLEEVTREVVEFEFEKQWQEGSVKMRSINLDEIDHEHYIDKYQLSVQSVIISEIHLGKEVRWKNLDRVWPLMGNQMQLFEYIQNEIGGYLKH